MPIFTTRRVIIFTGLTATAAGAAFTYKQTLIAARKKVLHDEAAQLEEKRKLVSHAADAPLAELTASVQNVKDFSQTVVTLWDDRQQRYKDGIRDSYSYLVALPESLGMLKGVSNHFQYGIQNLRQFAAFDITVSKVHNFGLLLSSMETMGVAKSCAALKELFSVEPLIHSVSSSIVALDRVSEVEPPASIAEANKTYAFVMESLERSIADATARYHVEAQPKAPELSIVGQTLSDRLNSFKTVCNPREVQNQKARAEQAEQEMKILRRLITIDDVTKATAAAAQSVQRLRPAPTESLDELDKYVLADDAVKGCVKQLDLWRSAAERFLIETQAASALRSYQTLLAHSLAQVHDVPSEPEQAK